MTDLGRWPNVFANNMMSTMDFDDGNSTGSAFPDNPNSNKNLSALGMVETLGINLCVFVILIAIFESNRFYKQIYLKRLQNKFQVRNQRRNYYFIIVLKKNGSESLSKNI